MKDFVKELRPITERLPSVARCVVCGRTTVDTKIWSYNYKYYCYNHIAKAVKTYNEREKQK